MKRDIAIIILMLLIPSIGFFTVGINGIVEQHYKITHYQPVKATVLSSRVKHTRSHHGSGVEDFYRPKIEYSYTVNGKTYKSNRVAIFKSHTGRNWARSVVREYPEGKVTTAFYNPNEPSDSFLLNKYLFLEAYGPILWSIPCWITALLVWRYYFGYSFKKLAPRKLEDSSWYDLPAYIRVKDKLRLTILVIVVGVGISGLTLWHYFSVDKPPYDSDAIYHAYACIGFFFIPFGCLVYYLFILKCVGEAKIYTTNDKFSLGDEITFRFQQKFRKNTTAERIRVEFVCEKSVVVERRNKKWYERKLNEIVERGYEQQFDLLDSFTGVTANEIDVERKCAIPTAQNPSSDPQTKIYMDVPRYSWYFIVVVPVLSFILYKVKFPITVEK